MREDDLTEDDDIEEEDRMTPEERVSGCSGKSGGIVGISEPAVMKIPGIFIFPFVV
jgi:hypothetical protein